MAFTAWLDQPAVLGARISSARGPHLTRRCGRDAIDRQVAASPSSSAVVKAAPAPP